jgi:class 3 adenylate cyclase
MKLLATARLLFHTIDPVYAPEFEAYRIRGNATKARIVVWIGLFFTLALFTVDYLRWRDGEFETRPLYRALFATHLLLLLLIVPAVLLRRWQRARDLARQRLGTRLVLGIAATSMLPMAVLSLADRGALTMFAIFMLILNLVFTLPHRTRFIANALAVLPMFVTVFALHHGQPRLVFVQIAESIGLLLPALVFATVQYNLQVSQFTRGKLLEHEKQRSDALLLNILPASVAEELKATGWVKPRFYPEATILFADFRNFSQICRRLSPQQLIDDLSHCFRGFDAIVARHGLERIKTIGDAYMCVAGVPEPTDDQAARAVGAALDMHAFLAEWRRERTAQDLPVFEARIGIHTGPVVAGVAGTTRFAFDIWGDAVNVAARIESAGEANRVNVSGATRALLDGRFRCTFRGVLPVKNIGEEAMFFVEA